MQLILSHGLLLASILVALSPYLFLAQPGPEWIWPVRALGATGLVVSLAWMLCLYDAIVHAVDQCPWRQWLLLDILRGRQDNPGPLAQLAKHHALTAGWPFPAFPGRVECVLINRFANPRAWATAQAEAFELTTGRAHASRRSTRL